MMLKLDFAIILLIISIFVSDAHDKQKTQKLPSRVLCSDEKCLGTLSNARVVNSVKCYGGNLKELVAGKRVEIFAKDISSNRPLWGVKMENLRCFVDKSFIKELNVISKSAMAVDNPLLPKDQSENSDDLDDTEDDEDIKDKPTENSRRNAVKTLDSSKANHEGVPSNNGSSSNTPSKDQSENKTPPESDGSRKDGGDSQTVPKAEAPSTNENEQLLKDESSREKSNEKKTEPLKDASSPEKSNEKKSEPLEDASSPINPDLKHSSDGKPDTLQKRPEIDDNKQNQPLHNSVGDKPKHMNEKTRESEELPPTEEHNASRRKLNNVEERVVQTPNEKADNPKESVKDSSEKDTEDDEGTDEDDAADSSPNRKSETTQPENKPSGSTQSSKLAANGLKNENQKDTNHIENAKSKESSIKSVEDEKPVAEAPQTTKHDDSLQSNIESKPKSTTKATSDIHASSKNLHPAEDKSRDTNADASEKERPTLSETSSQDMTSKSLKTNDVKESEEPRSVPVPSSTENFKSKSKTSVHDIQTPEKAADVEKSRNQADKIEKEVPVPPPASTAEDRLKRLRINAARRPDDQQLNTKGPKKSIDKIQKVAESAVKNQASALPKKSDDMTGETLKGNLKASKATIKKPGLSVNDPWLSSSKTELERCFRRFSETHFLISTLIYFIDVIRMPGRLIIHLMSQDTVKVLNDVLWTYAGLSLELLISGTLLFGYLLILSFLFQCCLCRRNFKADLIKKTDIVISLEEKISERDQLNSKLSENNIHLIKKIKEMEKRVSDEKKILEDESKVISHEKRQSEEHLLSLNKTIDELTSDKQTLEERIDTLQRESEDRINTEMKKCEVSVAELHSVLSDKDKELERLNSIVADMNENQIQLVEQANSYYESMTQMQKEVEKMHNDRNSLEQSLLSKDGEITQLRQSFQFLKSVQEIVDSEVNKEFSERKIAVDSLGQQEDSKQRSNSLHKDGDDVVCSDEEGETDDEEEDVDRENTADSAALNEAIEARKSEVLRTKLAEFLNISQLRIEMQTLQEHCLSMESKLRVAEESRGEMELRLDELKRDNNSLQTSRMEAEERQKVAQNKLDILSQYFKEREAEMQRNMGEQEVLKNRNANQMETHKSRAEILESEIGDMKKQLEAMEGELRESERSYRKQINELEKRAFDNWKASRTSEREVKEMKEENFALRQRLTEVERSRIPPLPSFQGIPRMPAQTKSNSGATVSSPINANPSFPMPPMLPPSMPPPMPPMPFMMPPRPPLGMAPNMGVDAQRPPSRQSLESETSRADAASMGRSFTNSDGRPLSRTSGVVPGGGMASAMPPPPSSMPFMPPPPGMRMPPPPSFPAMPPLILPRSPIGMMPNRQQHQKSPSTTSSTRPPR